MQTSQMAAADNLIWNVVCECTAAGDRLGGEGETCDKLCIRLPKRIKESGSRQFISVCSCYEEAGRGQTGIKVYIRRRDIGNRETVYISRLG